MSKKYIAKLFVNHQVIKAQRLLDEGISTDKIVEILKKDSEFFEKNILKGV